MISLFGNFLFFIILFYLNNLRKQQLHNLFNIQINPKMLLEDVRKAVQSTNPTVRQAAIGLLGKFFGIFYL